MAMKSAILSHPKRLEMDRAYLQGKSVASIGRDFDVSVDSLKYHFQHNLSRQLGTAMAKRELANNFDLLSEIDCIIMHTKEIFKRNFDLKKDVTALKALDSQRSTLELLSKISAYLHQTKLLELQEQQESTQQEQNADFSNRLEILTFDELQMLSKLQQKINSQDERIIVIPQSQPIEADKRVKRIRLPHIQSEPEEAKIEADSPVVAVIQANNKWEPASGQKVSWINGIPLQPVEDEIDSRVRLRQYSD